MKKITVCISLFLTLMLHAQPSANEYKEFIIWNENRQLTWKDFTGTAIPNAAEAAMTASSMEFSYNIKGNQLNWQVMVKFFPKLSWSKKNKESDYILKHEQLHFDITELYGRLFRRQLSEEIKSAKDVAKMKIISKSIMHQWSEEQNNYDKETKHSINEEKQAEWNVSIQERLDALKEYASK